MLKDNKVQGFQELVNGKWKKLTHDEYHDKKAQECGCGINCCNSYVVLPDQILDEPIYMTFENKTAVFRTKTELKAAYPDWKL